MTINVKVDTEYSDKKIKALEVAMKKINKFTEDFMHPALPITGRGFGRWSNQKNVMGARING